MKYSLSRTSLAACASTVALAAIAAPTAGAAPVVSVTTSTAYAVFPFPVTVRVTSSEAGTAQLMQVRPDRALGPGRCSGYNTRVVPGTSRAIAAGQTLTYSVAASSLAYNGGTLFPPFGWDNPSYPGYQDLCYDRLSTYNEIRGEVSTGAPTYGYGAASKPLTRLL